MDDDKQVQFTKDCKEIFASEAGKRALAHLKLICRANPSQSCFDAGNMYQTSYNLGAQWVPNYIQTQIDKKSEQKTGDCQTEPETERK